MSKQASEGRGGKLQGRQADIGAPQPLLSEQDVEQKRTAAVSFVVRARSTAAGATASDALFYSLDKTTNGSFYKYLHTFSPLVVKESCKLTMVK